MTRANLLYHPPGRLIVAVAILLCSACGGTAQPVENPSPSAATATDTEFAPAPQKVKTEPAPPGASCSVSDSNGPLEGGEQITTGCAENEICVCEAQAAYSCSGHCQAATSRGGLVGTSGE